MNYNQFNRLPKDIEQVQIDEGLELDDKNSSFEEDNYQAGYYNNFRLSTKERLTETKRRKEEEARKVSNIFNGENMDTILFSPDKPNLLLKRNLSSNSNFTLQMEKTNNNYKQSPGSNYKRSFNKNRFYGANDFYGSNRSRMSSDVYDVKELRNQVFRKESHTKKFNLHGSNNHRSNPFEDKEFNNINESSISLISFNAQRDHKEVNFNSENNFMLNYSDDSIFYTANALKNEMDYDVVSIWKNRSEFSSFDAGYESEVNKRSLKTKFSFFGPRNFQNIYKSSSSNNINNMLNIEETFRNSVRDKRALEEFRKSNKNAENTLSLNKKQSDNFGNTFKKKSDNSINQYKDNFLSEIKIMDSISQKVDFKKDYVWDSNQNNVNNMYNNNDHIKIGDINKYISQDYYNNYQKNGIGDNYHTNSNEYQNYLNPTNNYPTYKNEAAKIKKKSEKRLPDITETSKEEKSLVQSGGFVFGLKGSNIIEVRGKSIVSETNDKYIKQGVKNYENEVFKNVEVPVSTVNNFNNLNQKTDNYNYYNLNQDKLTQFYNEQLHIRDELFRKNNLFANPNENFQYQKNDAYSENKDKIVYYTKNNYLNNNAENNQRFNLESNENNKNGININFDFNNNNNKYDVQTFYNLNEAKISNYNNNKETKNHDMYPKLNNNILEQKNQYLFDIYKPENTDLIPVNNYPVNENSLNKVFPQNNLKSSGITEYKGKITNNEPLSIEENFDKIVYSRKYSENPSYNNFNNNNQNYVSYDELANNQKRNSGKFANENLSNNNAIPYIKPRTTVYRENYNQNNFNQDKNTNYYTFKKEDDIYNNRRENTSDLVNRISVNSNLNSHALNDSFSSRIKNLEDNLKSEINTIMDEKSLKIGDMIDSNKKNEILLSNESEKRFSVYYMKTDENIRKENLINSKVKPITYTDPRNYGVKSRNYLITDENNSNNLVSSLNSNIDNYKKNEYFPKFKIEDAIESNDRNSKNINNQENVNLNSYKNINPSKTSQNPSKPPIYTNKYISTNNQNKDQNANFFINQYKELTKNLYSNPENNENRYIREGPTTIQSREGPTTIQSREGRSSSYDGRTNNFIPIDNKIIPTHNFYNGITNNNIMNNNYVPSTTAASHINLKDSRITVISGTNEIIQYSKSNVIPINFIENINNQPLRTINSANDYITNNQVSKNDFYINNFKEADKSPYLMIGEVKFDNNKYSNNSQTAYVNNGVNSYQIPIYKNEPSTTPKEIFNEKNNYNILNTVKTNTPVKYDNKITSYNQTPEEELRKIALELDSYKQRQINEFKTLDNDKMNNYVSFRNNEFNIQNKNNPPINIYNNMNTLTNNYFNPINKGNNNNFYTIDQEVNNNKKNEFPGVNSKTANDIYSNKNYQPLMDLPHNALEPTNNLNKIIGNQKPNASNDIYNKFNNSKIIDGYSLSNLNNAQELFQDNYQKSKTPSNRVDFNSYANNYTNSSKEPESYQNVNNIGQNFSNQKNYVEKKLPFKNNLIVNTKPEDLFLLDNKYSFITPQMKLSNKLDLQGKVFSQDNNIYNNTNAKNDRIYNNYNDINNNYIDIHHHKLIQHQNIIQENKYNNYELTNKNNNYYPYETEKNQIGNVLPYYVSNQNLYNNNNIPGIGQVNNSNKNQYQNTYHKNNDFTTKNSNIDLNTSLSKNSNIYDYNAIPNNYLLEKINSYSNKVKNVKKTNSNNNSVKKNEYISLSKRTSNSSTNSNSNNNIPPINNIYNNYIQTDKYIPTNTIIFPNNYKK